MERKAFNFLASYYNALKRLPDDKRLKMVDAILNYSFHGTLPKFDDWVLESIWEGLLGTLKASREGWEAKVQYPPTEGGTPPPCQGGSSTPTEQVSKEEVSKEEKREEEERKEGNDYSAQARTGNNKIPSYAEWQSYWREKGKDTKDGNCLAAFEYWESQNWMRKGKPIESWRLAMVNNPQFKQSRDVEFDVDTEHCKDNPPKDWLDNMINRWGFTRKQAKDDWRRLRTHRADYYNPPKINPSGL
jgi:hypothetical protein